MFYLSLFKVSLWSSSRQENMITPLMSTPLGSFSGTSALVQWNSQKPLRNAPVRTSSGITLKKVNRPLRSLSHSSEGLCSHRLCYERTQISKHDVKQTNCHWLDGVGDVTQHHQHYLDLCGGSHIPVTLLKCLFIDVVDEIALLPFVSGFFWVSHSCPCCLQEPDPSGCPVSMRNAGSWWRPAGTGTLPRGPCSVL